jgi:TonB family protein
MKKLNDLRFSFTKALLLHGLILMVLIIQWQNTEETPFPAEHKIIQAFTIPLATPKVVVPPMVKPPEPIPEPQPVPTPDTVPEKEITKPKLKEEKVAAVEPIPKETTIVKKQPMPKVPTKAPSAKPNNPPAETQPKPTLAPVSPPAANAPAAVVNPDVERYRALIKTTIARYWLVPANLDKNLTAVIAVRLAPGGVVLDVQVVKSSGNASLDQSALQAINKASPLPVPADPDLFDQFRELRLTVRPMGVISQL